MPDNPTATAAQAARLRTEWRAALALVRRDEPDTTRAEQQAFDALVGYVEANGLQHSEFDPRRETTMTTTEITERLEYLRGEIRAERISYGEIVELQDLAEHIDRGDVELLQWAGVPEEEG